MANQGALKKDYRFQYRKFLRYTRYVFNPVIPASGEIYTSLRVDRGMKTIDRVYIKN